jgi:subtilisin family serine protease
MNGSVTRKALVLTVCVAALALGGCGGGGGGVRPEPISTAPVAPPPPPPPPPVPPPPPPPAPTTINYNDTEYQRSNGANAHVAIAAYNAGGTGRGIKIGVIDSGINPNLPEFAGRIDPASQDVAANRGLTDTEGHGTAVSATIVANREGAGIMGVAFESTIISLNTSNPNNCTAEDGCKHSDTAIGRAIDIARTNGARVINISLGGEGAGSAVLSAVSRATLAGIVVVISAGNEGEKPEGVNPAIFALRNAEVGNGLVIIAGAVDSNRRMATFSNKAGTGARDYLAALGVQVRTVDETGTAFLYSGTSFSSPIISGAAALLASAFPNLTGGQIVQLLLTSADDAGAPGTDTTFGRGILNIQRAFEPQGRTTLAGTGVPVSAATNGQGSSTMGDATGQAMAGAVILDGYSRAYALNLARTLSTAAQEKPLAQSLDGGEVRTAAATAGATSVAITVKRNLNAPMSIGMDRLGISYEDSRKAKVIAGMAVSRLTPRTAIAFGFSEGGRALQQRLTGHAQNAFLVARDPMTRSGFFADASNSIGIRQNVGSLGLTVTSERGKVWRDGIKQALGEPRYDIGAVTADRVVGPATLSLGASRLKEESTVLGGNFSSAFSSAGATSYFVDATASYDLGQGWGAYGSYRRGWTNLPGTGGLVQEGRFSTSAWAFDLSKRNALAPGDKLAVRVMQPLRVRGGGLNMQVPISYDYATLAVGYEDRFLSLTPTAREIDFETAYSRPLLGGELGLNAFYRRNPGHIRTVADDIGGAIRFTLGF